MAEHATAERVFTGADGTALAATVRAGQGPPIVLVHGAIADATGWRSVVEAIVLPNPVIVVNRRGRPPSGPLGTDYTLRTEVEDLHAVLDALGEPCVLFGHSYGGLIALEVARSRTDLRALVLYEPSVGPFGADRFADLVSASRRGDLVEVLRTVTLDISGLSQTEVAPMLAAEQWPSVRPLVAAVVEEIAAINGHEAVLTDWAGVSVPSTLVVGALNEGSPPFGTDFAILTGVMPAARVVRLAGQGHLAHVTAPHLLASVIAEAVE
ncbi:alpha/beta fold hydrolase [Kutzneria viridogrisea]|uniref:Pimeloyl-ACP methyl ester carboxylesterase n=1 Tax=Kutzneria viridogrisea TaxID=47990 RepID=A0ABR6BVA1_9PSEU|nr:pimeloyl-ACP methyl ester carboxylesterase [Kutzneria viridogrisea]